MAKETKVGLLAGLAFIICFAVILTNRGQTRRYAADTGLESALRMDVAPSRGPTVAGATEGRFRDVLPENNRIDAPVMRERALEQRLHMRRRAHIPTVSGSEIDWAIDAVDYAGNGAEPNGRAVSRVDQARPSHQSEPVRQARHDGHADARSALAELLRQRTGYGAALSSESQAAVATQTDSKTTTFAPSKGSASKECTTNTSHDRASARPLLTYRVVAGDTLSSIARHYYGAGTRRNIDAILDMNRSVLANPNMIKVGMSLVLPDWHREQTRAGSPRPVVDRDARLVVSRQRTTAVRWYQVRKNDRYVSIARQQLGDASRWREIYDLNKDKFPDPNQIRDGVRIKLPSR